MEGNLSESTSVLRPIGLNVYPGTAGIYFGNDPEPGIHCMTCRSLLDYDYVSPHLDLKRRRDFARASGRAIVSDKVRGFCLRNGYGDLKFILLNARRGLYEMRPTRVVHVDIAASKPDFSNLCTKCGQFDCTTIGRGVFLQEGHRPLEDGFYRTDLNWGCSTSKWPLTIIGLQTAEKLKVAGFKQIYTGPVPFLNPYWRGPRAVTEDRRYHVASMARARRELREERKRSGRGSG